MGSLPRFGTEINERFWPLSHVPLIHGGYNQRFFITGVRVKIGGKVKRGLYPQREVSLRYEDTH